jgi:geranylgeranyl diphosphate synthase type 3
MHMPTLYIQIPYVYKYLYTEEEYRRMVLDKTGGLFRLAVGLMQAFGDCQVDFTNLLNYLSLYFQIRDDYVNIAR